MPPAEKFQVLLVDDDAAIRRQLRGVLEDEGHTVDEAPNAAAAYAALEARRFDVVLLDIRMPGESGLDALERLSDQAPDTAVLIVSGEGSLENALKAGQRGAFDFVEKPFSNNALVDRVEQALDRSAQALRSRRERDSVAKALAELTEREAEVMRLVIEGRANKLIADELSISVRTVEVHRARVFEKMDVKSAVELANKLRGAGL